MIRGNVFLVTTTDEIAMRLGKSVDSLFILQKLPSLHNTWVLGVQGDGIRFYTHFNGENKTCFRPVSAGTNEEKRAVEEYIEIVNDRGMSADN